MPTYVANRFCQTVNGAPHSNTGVSVGGQEMPAGEHSIRVYVQPVNGAIASLSGSALHIQD